MENLNNVKDSIYSHLSMLEFAWSDIYYNDGDLLNSALLIKATV